MYLTANKIKIVYDGKSKSFKMEVEISGHLNTIYCDKIKVERDIEIKKHSFVYAFNELMQESEAGK